MPAALAESDGGIFAGIGFCILVVLAGFGNPISSARDVPAAFWGFSQTA